MATHFLTGAEFDGGALTTLLDRADELKRDRTASAALAGRNVTLIFERPSTRTRISAEAGVAELGGHAIVLREGEMQLSRGESLRDTALVLSRYVALIGVRTGPHATLTELAEHAAVPVVNLLTEEHHPCQALADLMTLRERFGRLDGLRLTYVGDGNNVAASLMILGAACGVRVVVSSPPGFEPAEAAVALARAGAGGAGSVDLIADPHAAAAGADALYTDVWVSMGDTDPEVRRTALAGHRIDADLLSAAAPTAIVLHCLPAHVGEEITEDALYGDRSAIFDQAENRLHAQKSLFERLVAP